MIQGVIARMSEDTAVQQIVGRNKSGSGYNVYPVYCPEEETDQDDSFITALITGTTPTNARCVSELDQVAFDVICYAAEYEVMDRLANLSRLSIDGFQGASAGVEFASIRFTNQVDTVDESTGLFARVMSYNAGIRRKINQPNAMG